MTGAALLEDGCDGFLFPSPVGSAIDGLRALDDLDRAGRMGGAVAALEPAARARVVASPLAALAPDDRPARWLIGAPDGEGYVAVLGEHEIGEGLWLPHHHAVLHSGGGPVAVRVRDGVSSITWADGIGLALPAGDRDTPVWGDAARFVRQPAVAGIPVLNGVPEVAGRYGSFEPLPVDEAGVAGAALAEGLALLGEVWPEALLDVLRLCRGVVLLAPREWSRSHSPAEAPGLVLVTVDGPEKIADLLCHECSHVRLNILLAADPLLENGDDDGYESPWRPDPRPLLGLLLGVHAFVAVVGWYRRLQATRHRAEVWDDVIARQAANLRAGWETLQHHGRPTPTGGLVLEALGGAVDEVCADG